jgi:hypothetical protein
MQRGPLVPMLMIMVIVMIVLVLMLVLFACGRVYMLSLVLESRVAKFAGYSS